MAGTWRDLGNISSACEEAKVTRSTFSEFETFFSCLSGCKQASVVRLVTFFAFAREPLDPFVSPWCPQLTSKDAIFPASLHQFLRSGFGQLDHSVQQGFVVEAF